MSNKMKAFLPIFIIIIGVIMLASTLVANQRRSSSLSQSTTLTSSRLDAIKRTKTLRVGYDVYPPYIEKDPKTGEVSGYTIDIVKAIADQTGVRVEFVETNWQVVTADLQNDKFDLIGPLFVTVPRAEQISFTEPMGYFSSVAAIVKKDDNRFTTIDDLNKKGITIAVPQAWNADLYAQKNLPNATIKRMKDDSAALTLADVAAGNSDVALADGPTVQQYLEKNPNQPVKGLFLDNPPVIVPAGFGIHSGDPIFQDFLNKSIDVLRTNGDLKRLAQKYHLYSYDIETKYIPQ